MLGNTCLETNRDVHVFDEREKAQEGDQDAAGSQEVSRREFQVHSGFSSIKMWNKVGGEILVKRRDDWN